MVAKIISGKSILKALNYNEQKVHAGKAQCLEAVGFLKDASRLTFSEKLHHFNQLIMLNERTKTNAVHISLNFDPSENLSSEKLAEIAKSYIEKIGFERQPFLIYQHLDAGHPHIHIVSTSSRPNGTRISLHNIGRNQSEKARKEIEKEFGLIKAESKKVSKHLKLQPVNAEKVIYGKSETRRAIENVLSHVLHQYRYTSLPELNAVLKLYNIAADRGSEESRLYKHRGLTYRILNQQGEKVGVPIKASALSLKPTLTFLEQKFRENEAIKKQHLSKLKTTLDWTLAGKHPSLQDFMKALERERVSTVLRIGKEGVIYGITYVDHRTHCVFNGSDMGKLYSAKSITERFNQGNTIELHQPYVLNRSKEKAEVIEFSLNEKIASSAPSQQSIADVLITPLQTTDYLPHQLKKKKKKKSQSNHL